MDEKFVRTGLLLGEEGVSKLNGSSVMIFGVGGVGSFTAEALARCGVGRLIILDFDTVAVSNINRQLHALVDTVGEVKVEAMKNRILKINPDISIEAVNMRADKDNIKDLVPDDIDYLVDAIDTVTAKIALIEYAYNKGIPIISAMGAGNKLNPAMLEVSDIYSTSICPLARVMRKELRKRDVDRLKVVYSKEEPLPHKMKSEAEEGKRAPGSVSFVPSVSGLIIASEVVKDLLGI